MTPEKIYLKARELVGTPYLHQGRVKGAGIDCVGVPIWTVNQLGLSNYDIRAYPRKPDGTMLKKISGICNELETVVPGALLVFKISVEPQHCAIVSNYDELGIIHAWDLAERVIEHKMSKYWLNRIVGCYGLPGVEYE